MLPVDLGAGATATGWRRRAVSESRPEARKSPHRHRQKHVSPAGHPSTRRQITAVVGRTHPQPATGAPSYRLQSRDRGPHSPPVGSAALALPSSSSLVVLLVARPGLLFLFYFLFLLSSTTKRSKARRSKGGRRLCSTRRSYRISRFLQQFLFFVSPSGDEGGTKEAMMSKRKGKKEEQGEGLAFRPLASPHWSIFSSGFLFLFFPDDGVTEEPKGKALPGAAGLAALVDFSGFYFSFFYYFFWPHRTKRAKGAPPG